MHIYITSDLTQFWTPINSSQPLGRELPVETHDLHSLRHKWLSCFAWNKNIYSSDSGDGAYITTDCDTRMEQLCIITSLLDNWCRRLADKARKLTLLFSLSRCWSHLYSLRRNWYRWLILFIFHILPSWQIGTSNFMFLRLASWNS